MKLRLWPRRTGVEPAHEDTTTAEPAAPSEPEPAPERERPAPIAQPSPPAPEELPAKVTLTLDQAKAAIRAAKGDVIQVGFLAADYKRHQEDDPRSADTTAARRLLCDLVAKRLRDRRLLAPDGIFELREGAGDKPERT
jgi:hypothetical protein